MRSHVVFKFLNYVTDKIVRVLLTTLALMLRCVQNYMYICEREREREREGYVLSVHDKTILWQKQGQDLSILSFCLLYLFVWPVSLWVLVILLLNNL